MSARRFLPALAAAVALVASACGGTGGSAEPVRTTDVTMAKSYRFAPERIRISAGQTVTWTNDDNFTHTVKVDGQDDHKVSPGEHVSIAFPKAGTYEYVCTLHSRDMSGEVVVE
jgi:plastocyanin